MGFKADALTWDEYFMYQAMTASLRSKDPVTKVGCFIVDEDNHQVGMGYNGMVAKADETKFTWNKNKEDPYHLTKYAYVIHAESNAILHSNAILKNCRLYVTLFPCNECAKMIASKKIKEVIYLSNPNENKPENLASKIILDAAGISHRQFKMSDDKIKDICNQLLTLNNK
jgi:dCMP deaminase